jgi:protein ImuB
LFAVLHIADFALHAVLRTEREDTCRPAALFSGTSKKSVVLAANPAARIAGVELGMTAPQAVARCPTLTIRAPNSPAEAEARAALLAVGFTLSPTIEDTAPGVCTIDLKGITARIEALAAVAIAQLTQLGLPVAAGIARTPLLALYAARSAAHRSRSSFSFSPADADSPCVAEEERTKNDYEERERIFVITDEKNFLGPLPLAAADPSPELAAILHGWGLRTLGDLTALPRDDIVCRFGAAGLALWQRAAGGDTRPLHPVVLPQIFSATMEFEDAVETLEPLLFILRRFIDRLTLELRASQHVAVELHLALRLEDDTQHARSFRLPEPTADPDILFRALHTHLESVQTAAAIIAVQLQLTPARPLIRQQGLFETGLRDPHGFAETLARVTALVGNDRVGTPQLEDTHRPDTVKLTPPAAVVPAAAGAPVHPPFGLPLRRFRPPLRATVELLTGEQQPAYVFTDRFHGAIRELRGPWRSSGDWWQGDRTWSRTEWDVALETGGLYRLLLIGESYFVEGEYD